MARNTTESPIEQYLADRVKAAKGRCLKVIVRNQKGSPDRWCLMPGGHIFMVECKHHTGRLSPAQVVFNKFLTAQGFNVYTVYSK